MTSSLAQRIREAHTQVKRVLVTRGEDGRLHSAAPVVKAQLSAFHALADAVAVLETKLFIAEKGEERALRRQHAAEAERDDFKKQRDTLAAEVAAPRTGDALRARLGWGPLNPKQAAENLFDVIGMVFTTPEVAAEIKKLNDRLRNEIRPSCPHCKTRFRGPVWINSGRLKCGTCEKWFDISIPSEEPHAPTEAAPAPRCYSCHDPEDLYRTSDGRYWCEVCRCKGCGGAPPDGNTCLCKHQLKPVGPK